MCKYVDGDGSLADHVDPVTAFRSVLARFDGYPPDVVPVPEQLPGTAAFAASAGLYRLPGTSALPPFPYNGLMIIGHNLDSVDGYEARRRSGVSHGDVVPWRTDDEHLGGPVQAPGACWR